MVKRTIPTTTRAIETAYQHCENNKKYREVDKALFSDYLVRSQKDITSADNDFKNEDYHWARIKAYQSLFHMLNALLVKKLGYFSKDHGCIIFALLKHGVLTDPVAGKLRLIASTPEKDCPETPEEAIQDIDDFRIQRNFALYKPKAWEDVTRQDIEEELKKIKGNLSILGGLL